MTTSKKSPAPKSSTGRRVTRSKSPAKPAAEQPKPAAKTDLNKTQLTKAAKLRTQGATWNTIRAEFGVKHGSSTWFRLWERNEIDHIPAGERVKPALAATPAAEPAQDA